MVFQCYLPNNKHNAVSELLSKLTTFLSIHVHMWQYKLIFQLLIIIYTTNRHFLFYFHFQFLYLSFTLYSPDYTYIILDNFFQLSKIAKTKICSKMTNFMKN